MLTLRSKFCHANLLNFENDRMTIMPNCHTFFVLYLVMEGNIFCFLLGSESKCHFSSRSNLKSEYFIFYPTKIAMILV